MDKLRLEELQDHVRKLTKMVIQGYLPGLGIVGPGGLGKSYSVSQAFTESGLAPPIFNSHAAPLGLYSLLYHHRDTPALVLEDMEQVYANTAIVSILRSALSGPEDKEGRKIRRVSWISTTSKLEEMDIPKEFEFKGGIIMIGNRFPEKNEFFQALMTRVPTVLFRVKPEEVFEFMHQQVKRGRSVYDAEKKEAQLIPARECLHVLKHFEAKGVTDLRAFDHALVIYLRHKAREKWKALVDELLLAQPQREKSVEEVVAELERDPQLSTGERARLFRERTRLSRATFFRIKSRLKRGFGSGAIGPGALSTRGPK